MTRIAVHGAAGRMGCAVIRAVVEQQGAELVSALDRADHPAAGRDAGLHAGLGEELGLSISDAGASSMASIDVVIDFSLPAALSTLVTRCGAESVALVTGTTGLSAAQSASLEELSGRIAVVAAPNFSVGVNVFWELSRRAAELLGDEYDLEIVEMHHRHKVDAPSGTAVKLAQVVADARGADASQVVTHGRQGQVGARPAPQIGMHALRGGGVVGDHTLILAGPAERVEVTHRAQGREIFAQGAVRAALWAAGQGPGSYQMADVLGIG